MNDHITVPLSYHVNVITSSERKKPVYEAAQVALWNTQGKGFLSSAGGDYLGLKKIPQALRTNFSAETKQYLSSLPADWPEIIIGVFPNGLDDRAQPVPGPNYATLLATPNSPASRGTASIVSVNMADAPIIDPNLFSA